MLRRDASGSTSASRDVRSRGLLEALRAEKPQSDVDTEHVWHPSPMNLDGPTCSHQTLTLSFMCLLLARFQLPSIEAKAARFLNLPDYFISEWRDAGMVAHDR